MIENDRKVIVAEKLITYGNIQKHYINFEKHMRVKRDNDIILQDIKRNILPFDIEIVEEIEKKVDGEILSTIYKTHMGNYIWSNLLPVTKRYLRENDKKFSIFEYVQYDKINNNTSIYEYREKRLLKLYPDLEITDNDAFNKLYEDVVVIGKVLPLPITNKAYMSARRSYKQVKSLALCNCDTLTCFCTFTFADIKNVNRHLELNNNRNLGEKDIKFKYVDNDYEIKVQAFSTFLENLKKKLKKQYKHDLKYISVPEEHKSGDIHFHALMNELPVEILYDNPEWLDLNFKANKRFYGKGFNDWKHGKSDVQPIHDKEKVATYIAKYMLKNFLEVSPEHYQKYLNKRRFNSSYNLVKPSEKYLFDKEEIDNLMNEVSANTYHEEYYNPYSESIIHKYILPIT